MHLAKPLSALSLLAAGAAQALTLTVEITDARSTEGSVNAAIYAADGNWLKAGDATQAVKAASAGDKTVLVFANLAPGRYGITAYHDENGNGQLDRNVLGMPTERFGFTRDARGIMGPPSFADAAVELEGDTTLRITLR